MNLDRPSDAPGTLDILRFTSRYWRRQARPLAGQVGLMLAATGCDMAAPWATSRLLNVAAHAPRDAGAAVRALAVLVTLFFLQFMCRSGALAINNHVTTANMRAVAQDMLARTQSFSAAWHADNRLGATARTVGRAMQAYMTVSDAVFITLGPSLLLLAGMAASIGARWPAAGGLVAGAAIFYVALNLVLTARWLKPLNARANGLDGEVSAAFTDVVANISTVRDFAAEPREAVRFADLTSRWRGALLRAWNRSTTLSTLQGCVLVALQAGLLGLLTAAWMAGRASVGDLAFGISAFLLIAGYLRNIPDILRLFRRGVDEMAEAVRLARTPPQIGDRAGATRLRPARGGRGAGVAFESVTFGHPGARQPLLSRFDLVIAPGEHVAVVGETGSGKSTLALLLTRVHEPQDGRILVDGEDIAGLTLASLRAGVARVSQEPALFHRTVAENLAYARPDADRAAMEAAARRACAHDFITHLPHGYDTLVGDRGCKLSGGERQRLALARAFLADAPILVLDEATSALDAETERKVMRATAAFMAGRTTLVIAHRLSTVRSADRILVLEEGRVVEAGDHANLLALGGRYARLVGEAPERTRARASVE